MIEEPKTLKILGRASRPRPNVPDAFATVPTGNLCDAMDGTGALDPEIKPIEGLPNRLIGPALPVECGPADILPLLAALSEITPGDVLVVATGGWRGCAALGDLVTGMARNAGAAGIVTDGMVRDLDGLAEVGLPVFGVGVNPNSPYSSGPGRVGYPVDLGGRRVGPGDIVVGDRDGVVTIPVADIGAVETALGAVREAEAGLEAEVRAGLKVPEAIRSLLESDEVEIR